MELLEIYRHHWQQRTKGNLVVVYIFILLLFAAMSWFV